MISFNPALPQVSDSPPGVQLLGEIPQTEGHIDWNPRQLLSDHQPISNPFSQRDPQHSENQLISKSVFPLERRSRTYSQSLTIHQAKNSNHSNKS